MVIRTSNGSREEDPSLRSFTAKHLYKHQCLLDARDKPVIYHHFAIL